MSHEQGQPRIGSQSSQPIDSQAEDSEEVHSEGRELPAGGLDMGEAASNDSTNR